MAHPSLMPQMGESIAEGTIVRWIKKVGEEVGRDEPLFEISTDKVDAEIPSPAAGVLAEIKVREGETVPSTASSRRSATRRRDARSRAAATPAPGGCECRGHGRQRRRRHGRLRRQRRHASRYR